MSALAQHFDRMYARDDDPWRYRDSAYERRKRALTLALLPRERYHRVFEPGCSIGELTHALAPRCDELLACDASARAVASARSRLSTFAHVRIRHAEIPGDWPEGTFDLIVLSEFVYYLDTTAMHASIERARASLEPQGELLACHWRHPIPEGPCRGDDVHRLIAACSGFEPRAHYEERDFLIDVWTCPQAPSLKSACAQP